MKASLYGIDLLGDMSNESSSMSSRISAYLSYIEPSNVTPISYAYEPPVGIPWESAKYKSVLVDIVDGRSMPGSPKLEAEGFELWSAQTQVTDFQDRDQIRETYYGECIELALQVTRGSRAYVFDHLLRRRERDRSPLSFGKRGADGLTAVNGRIHNDYSERSGSRRLEMVLPDAKDRESITSFSIINIWRSIKGPILDTPLALCDARSVSPSDLVVSEVMYPNRTGEIYAMTHSNTHRWAYFSQMDRHEAVVFKQFDSRTQGVARFVPHAAFDLPAIPPDAPLRESIEVRCLVVYDGEAS